MQDELIWDELFLLKVNVKVLEEHFSKLTSNDLVQLKDPINTLFRHCVNGLKEEHDIKSLNILMVSNSVVSNILMVSNSVVRLPNTFHLITCLYQGLYHV